MTLNFSVGSSATKRFLIACLATIPVVGLAVTQQALAEIKIRVSDGVHTKTSNDLGTPGFAAFSGKIGNFDAKIEEGIGFPAIGSPSDLILDLTSVDLTSKTGGTLTVSLTETGFSGGAAEELLSSLTGIYVNSSAQISIYLGKNDKPFWKVHAVVHGGARQSIRPRFAARHFRPFLADRSLDHNRWPKQPDEH